MDSQIDMARRLLVVDDERLQRFVVSQVMVSLGFVAEGIETPALHTWLARRASIPA